MNKLSIKSKLLCLVIGILVPMGVGGLYSTLQLSNYSEKLLTDTYAQNAKELNSAIATLFFERYGDVQAFAVNQAVISMNEETMTEFLDHYVTLYGIYDLILVVDKDGNFVASNNKDVAGKTVNKDELKHFNFKDTPWFQAAINKQFTEDKSKGFVGTYVEDFIYDPLQKKAFEEDRTASSFTSLIKNGQGETLGVITNRAGSRWFEGEMIKLYDNLKSQGLVSSEIALLNKDGFILSEYDPSVKGAGHTALHDPEIVLKKNLFTLNYDATNFLRDKKSGSIISIHLRKKVEQIVGYSFNDDAKFISDLGWSILVRENKEVALANQGKIMTTTYSTIAIIVVLSLLGAFWFANNLSANITNITEQVAIASGMVASASEELSKSSGHLSNAAQSQVNSIETTSTSLKQISGKVNLNVKSAENANLISQEVKKHTNETQKSISDLSHAMSEILDSNHRIEKLVRIIEQIGQKTEIIDDIVFQTQLLSFNASVEAERAGEHGRGFAVVAQEVGSLAQMSGVAATEISNIVKNSIKEAEAVAKENKAKVENGGHLVQNTQKKIQQVITQMTAIHESTNEIVGASREQAMEIKQITGNIENLSQTTQQTASGAAETASFSTELASQGECLMNLVDQMKQLVLGEKALSQSTHKFEKQNSPQSSFNHESVDHSWEAIENFKKNSAS